MSRLSIRPSTLSGAKEWTRVAMIVLALLSGCVTASSWNNISMRLGSELAKVKDVMPGEYPFLVSIDIRCDGVIIDEQHILTAGHCAEPYFLGLAKPGEWLKPIMNMQIKVGAHDLNSNKDGRLYNIAEVMIHGGYNATTNSNDISILKLECALEFDPQGRVPIGRINRPNACDCGADRQWLTVAGWGMHNSSLPKQLSSSITPMKMGVHIKPIEECREIEPLKDGPGHWRTKLCASSLIGSENEFRINSGSPLFRSIYPDSHELIGIAVCGRGCKRGKYEPRVYTRVIQYFEWIREQTEGSPPTR